jgi:hypothetical protein
LGGEGAERTHVAARPNARAGTLPPEEAEMRFTVRVTEETVLSTIEKEVRQ